jgi:hypothetical protein
MKDSVALGDRSRVGQARLFATSSAHGTRVPGTRRTADPGRDSGEIQGGLVVVYGVNIPDLFRRSVSYIDRILKGARPGDLPMEQPTKLEVIVNLKTAKALGLTIPPVVLARADEVIQ